MGGCGGRVLGEMTRTEGLSGRGRSLVQWKLPGIHEEDTRENSYMGDTEPELSIFCNQAWLPVQGLGHQPSHRTFDLQFALPARCPEVEQVQNLWEWPASDWSSLRPKP